MDELIARHGVTYCPPAICAETRAVLPADAVAFHTERHREQEQQRRSETKQKRGARLFGFGKGRK